MVKEFDWTYSTLWPGGVSSHAQPKATGIKAETESQFEPALDPIQVNETDEKDEFEPLDPPSPLHPNQPYFSLAQDRNKDRIPLERLGAGSEPILFFDQLILFEDELHDNGSSVLDIKVVCIYSNTCITFAYLHNLCFPYVLPGFSWTTLVTTDTTVSMM